MIKSRGLRYATVALLLAAIISPPPSNDSLISIHTFAPAHESPMIAAASDDAASSSSSSSSSSLTAPAPITIPTPSPLQSADAKAKGRSVRALDWYMSLTSVLLFIVGEAFFVSQTLIVLHHNDNPTCFGGMLWFTPMMHLFNSLFVVVSMTWIDFIIVAPKIITGLRNGTINPTRCVTLSPLESVRSALSCWLLTDLFNTNLRFFASFSIFWCYLACVISAFVSTPITAQFDAWAIYLLCYASGFVWHNTFTLWPFLLVVVLQNRVDDHSGDVWPTTALRLCLTAVLCMRLPPGDAWWPTIWVQLVAPWYTGIKKSKPAKAHPLQ